MLTGKRIQNVVLIRACSGRSRKSGKCLQTTYTENNCTNFLLSLSFIASQREKKKLYKNGLKSEQITCSKIWIWIEAAEEANNEKNERQMEHWPTMKRTEKDEMAISLIISFFFCFCSIQSIFTHWLMSRFSCEFQQHNNLIRPCICKHTKKPFVFCTSTFSRLTSAYHGNEKGKKIVRFNANRLFHQKYS